MAQFKNSWKSLRDNSQRYSYIVDQTHHNPAEDRRYIIRNSVQYYEDGMVYVNGWFDRRPEVTYACAIEARVDLVRAKEANTDLYLPDGTKIPKAWIPSNPILLFDVQAGLYLNAGGHQPIIYAHRDAVPYTQNVIKVRVKAPRQEIDAQTKRCNDVWHICRTAAKMGAGAEKVQSYTGFMEWLRDPKGLLDTSLGLQWKLSVVSDLRSEVEDALATYIEVPYLLNRRVA